MKKSNRNKLRARKFKVLKQQQSYFKDEIQNKKKYSQTERRKKPFIKDTVQWDD